MTTSTRRLTLRSSDGLALEAALDAPKGPGAVVVLCHPHPQMGGTMNAPLLGALADAFMDEGWAALRFNFRGIGDSEGEASVGLAEVADVEGAVAEARRLDTGVPVAVVGWSFGAAVAVRFAERDDSLAGCVAIAPAVESRPEITAGLPDPERAEVDVPLLLVCAVNDHLVRCDDCIAWAQTARADHVRVKGANHFFWGKYEVLAAEVTGWLHGVL